MLFRSKIIETHDDEHNMQKWNRGTKMDQRMPLDNSNEKYRPKKYRPKRYNATERKSIFGERWR